MTYRECYAQHVQAQHLVDDVHLRSCPGALRDFGVKVPYSRQLGCPFVDDTFPVGFEATCAACWDKEMEQK